MYGRRRHHDHGFFLLFLVFVLLLCPCLAAFEPADNYLLNCGAPANTTAAFSDGTDTRSFVPDSSPANNAGVTFSFAGSSTLTNPNSPSNSDLYRTARFFPNTSSYNFSVKKGGIHVVRLHFYLFSTETHDLFSSVFNVSISGNPILTSFSPNSTSNSEPLVLKEFFVPISNVTAFSISFSSSGFVAAIEVFSAPDELFNNTPSEIESATRIVDYNGLSLQVLETLYRINVGGEKVTPNNDTLWRTWLTDDDFLETKSLAQTGSGTVKYQSDQGLGPSKEIAPASVYSTLREINPSNYNVSSGDDRLRWGLNVSSRRQSYLVRMHYCDLTSASLHDLVFDSYINNLSAFSKIDIATEVREQSAVPYYTDSVVNVSDLGVLRIEVGPSDDSKPNAILNGLEIMRIRGELRLQNITEKDRSSSVALIVGAVIGSLIVSAVVVSVALVIRGRRRRRSQKKKKNNNNNSSKNAASSNPTTSEGSWWNQARPLHSHSTDPRGSETPLANLNLELKMPFTELLVATDYFDEKNGIGQGGFGKVYKGVLQNGTRIAVKRGTRGAGQGLSEFYTEILMLSKIRHRHLVSLIGYCEEQSEMILVYEFMEKGTLRDHLYGSSSSSCLPWKQRLEICIGSAKGLHYLHTGPDAQGIIHRDVKSANILLDENFVAKVADFGLSKFGPLLDQTHVSTNVKGSFGYFDPEYFKTQQLTDKSDVYSFGVVLLEVLTARPAIDRSLPWEEQNLADWGLKCIRKGDLDGILDAPLKDTIKPNSLRSFTETVEKCLQPFGVDRPSMATVLWNLEYALKLQETDRTDELFDESVTGVSTVIHNNPTMGSTSGISRNHVEQPVQLGDHDSQISMSSNVFSQLISSQGR